MKHTRILRWLVAWIAGLYVKGLDWTCTRVVHDDPRPALRDAGRPYIYAILHAHQIAACITHGESRCAALVSRSADGDLLLPTCTLHKIHPVRGSSRKQGVDKGGSEALQQLVSWVEQTGAPVTIAVDGPRGPRNHVHAGIALLAQRSGAAIICAVVVPRRRWFLSKTWDRFQIPRPFARIDVAFQGQPIDVTSDSDIDAVRQQVAAGLADLEQRFDASEVAILQPRHNAAS